MQAIKVFIVFYGVSTILVLGIAKCSANKHNTKTRATMEVNKEQLFAKCITDHKAMYKLENPYSEVPFNDCHLIVNGRRAM